MADDIDDLLNDVESKFCAPSKGGKSHNGSGGKPTKPRSTASKDLDAMIDDIFDEDGDTLGESCNKSASSQGFTQGLSRKGSTGAPGRRCFPVFIANPSCARGLSSTVNNRACDNLRCTDCDFEVCNFPNYSWHSSVDYLFLRNNIPDFDRLKPKLVAKKGCCAYACQCKWRSVKETTNLQEVADLKWVCGKH